MAAAARHALAFDPSNLRLARLAAGSSSKGTAANTTANSAIDVLVCTPGRLVDHLDNTPGFTLQHLRILIVDEADRLLSQTYQNWIHRVIEDAHSASVRAWRAMEAAEQKGQRVNPFQLSSDGLSYKWTSITWRRGGSAGGDTTHFNTNALFSCAAAKV